MFKVFALRLTTTTGNSRSCKRSCFYYRTSDWGALLIKKATPSRLYVHSQREREGERRALWVEKSEVVKSIEFGCVCIECALYAHMRAFVLGLVSVLQTQQQQQTSTISSSSSTSSTTSISHTFKHKTPQSTHTHPHNHIYIYINIYTNLTTHQIRAELPVCIFGIPPFHINEYSRVRVRER